MGMGLALEKDFAFVGSVNARQDLDQGAFAAPVFAREAVEKLTSVRARTPPKRLLIPRISMKSGAFCGEAGSRLLLAEVTCSVERG